jgi:hypothetical protein
MTFTCTHCHKELDEIEFTSRKNGKRYAWCKTCKKEYNERYYDKNSERHCAYVGEKRERKTHTCKHCGRSAPEVKFYKRKVDGRSYPYFICSECAKEYHKKYPTSKEATERHRKKTSAKEKVKRASPEFRAKFILSDSKRADRKSGRENDLDLGFIEMLIMRQCSYCGGTDERMTLDRMNNSLGHIKSNVVIACSRCNYFRRDMPYSAWLMLVPGLKKAHRLGLLDGWLSGTWKRNHKEVLDAKKILDEL